MIKIADVPSLASAGRVKRKKTEDDGVFDGFLSATDDADGAAGSEALATSQPLSAAGSLLLLQEVSDEELRRQQAMQHSRSALEGLEELRRELLFGGVPADRLGSMRQKLTNLRQAMQGNPELAEVMSDIELRLAVEIAKLEQA